MNIINQKENLLKKNLFLVKLKKIHSNLVNVLENQETWRIVFFFLIFQSLSYFIYLRPEFSGFIWWVVILFGLALSAWKVEYGIGLLFFEFLAGQGGHYFEFLGISVRLALFGSVFGVWLVKKIFFTWLKKKLSGPIQQLLGIQTKPWHQRLDTLTVFFISLLLVISFSVLIGLIKGNGILAIKDLINYSYLLLVFPLKDLLRKKEKLRQYFPIVAGGVIGITLLTFLVLFLFSVGQTIVHGSFYWWWRSVVIGKATDLGHNFFRIVTPAHLLLLPLSLMFISLIVQKGLKIEKKFKWVALAILASSCLLINFSRAYFLGILAGLFLLKKGLAWKRWILGFLIVLLVLILQFNLIYYIVTGQWSGLDFLTGRLGTMVSPESELSSRTRLVLLPLVLERIKSQPVMPNGLGQRITFINPLDNRLATTFHLDWGYLEIWLELGLIGLILFAGIFLVIFSKAWKKLNNFKKQNDHFWIAFTRGALMGLLGLIIATLTGPFLFHPLGIIWICFTAALVWRS